MKKKKRACNCTQINERPSRVYFSRDMVSSERVNILRSIDIRYRAIKWTLSRERDNMFKNSWKQAV